MIVYWFWAFLAMFFSKIKLNRRQGITFLGILLVVILSLRSMDLGFTDTRYVYYEAFKRLGMADSIFDAVKDVHFRAEPLMAMYIYSLSHLVPNFQLFMAVTALLSLWPLIRLARKEKFAYFTLVFFFSMYFFFYFYLLKQMLAIAVTVLAFECIMNDKPVKYFLLCFVASMIHKFSWPCFIAYPLCKFVRFTKKTYAIIAGIIFFGIAFSDMVLELIVKIDPTGWMISYINIYRKDARFNFGMILNIAILIFAAVMRKKITEDKDAYNKLLILSSLNCILNTYSLIVVEFQRLAFFFGIYNAILLPIALDALPIKAYYKKLIIDVVMVLLLAYGVLRTAANTQCIPYIFFWE